MGAPNDNDDTNSAIDTDPCFVSRVLVVHSCPVCVAVTCRVGVFFSRLFPENEYKLKYKNDTRNNVLNTQIKSNIV